MNERVARLRTQSVETKPYVSAERAELITEFYQSDEPGRVSVPVCRAKAFKHFVENKRICINEDELIVGERGPGPKATPTYPELCCHSLDDFRRLNTRDKNPFVVSDDVIEIYERKIIPFWRGKTMREKVFAAMSDEWTNAFKAGVFTEFMEQRAPGHAVLGDKIYRRGMLDFKEDIAGSRASLDFLNDPAAWSKNEQLMAMDICIDAIMAFAHRHADKALQLAEEESDSGRRAELKKIAEVCRHVPAHAPRDFHEALQSYWFVHLSVIMELNVWDSFNPGRLDQNLYPFFHRQVQNSEMTIEQAKELLQCFWIKFNNHIAPPKVDVTDEQSGTYTDFALINVGGVKPDGSDAVNELSYLILDVVEEMHLTQPSACIQLSGKNPERFLKRACRVIGTGFGQPSVFNTDVIIEEFLHAGKSMADARAGGPSGCVTISAFGKESCTLTGYCNWPKVFELACNNGVDPCTGMQIGPQTGDPCGFTCFDEFMEASREQMKYVIDLKVAGNNVNERLYAAFMPTPVMSILVDDCIADGRDYHNGGPRYNPTYITGVGLGTVTDAMAAVKFHVFDNKTVTMHELTEAVQNDFEDDERLRQMLLNRTPKYGDDDEYADSITEQVFDIYYDLVNGRANTKGDYYRVNMLVTTVHIYFGGMVGALPNGRKAGEPLSDGISPSQGLGAKGPTAIAKSASRIDHARTGGTLLNMKFIPEVFDNGGIDNLAHLIRGYFTLGGHHVQFNVIDAKTMRQAQENPEQHRDLIVRVAGYSDYFVNIGRDLQNEIISRTELRSF